MGILLLPTTESPPELMLNLADGGFEETLNAVRQAKVQLEKIEAEIAQFRTKSKVKRTKL